MSDEDDSSKTEEPTSKKLSDARGKGNVVQSRDVSSVLMLISGTVGIYLLGPPLMSKVTAMSRSFLERPQAMSLNEFDMTVIAIEVVVALAIAMAFIGGLFVVTAFLTSYLQFGLLVKEEAFKFDLDRLNPINGAKNLFSFKSVFEMLKGLMKMILIGGLIFYMMWPVIEHIDAYIYMAPGDLLKAIEKETRLMMFYALGILIVLAAGDYAYQHYTFFKSMRMTKHDVKDEFKQMEGDPQIKGKIRQLRAEKARRRMMAAVPGATVVVTNPTHFAVALLYESGMQAPKLVAKGQDLVALRIRDIAKAHDVPIVENPPLARSLYAAVDLDAEIHPDHYKAVAEVISYVFKLQRRVAR